VRLYRYYAEIEFEGNMLVGGAELRRLSWHIKTRRLSEIEGEFKGMGTV